MSRTPDRFFDVAASLKGQGETTKTILKHLLDKGARPVDLIRVVIEIESVDVATARKIIAECGVAEVQPNPLLIVPPGDPWHEMIFGPKNSHD